MRIRDAERADVPALIDLTIEVFRPLFEQHWPAMFDPTVFAHDHGHWEADYRQEVPDLLDPLHGRFITLAEEDGDILGYAGWNVSDGDTGRLELVAVHPAARRRGVGAAVCRAALQRMTTLGVAVVHVGTGGDAFHAPARGLYESLGFTAVPAVNYSKALGPQSD